MFYYNFNVIFDFVCVDGGWVFFKCLIRMIYENKAGEMVLEIRLKLFVLLKNDVFFLEIYNYIWNLW